MAGDLEQIRGRNVVAVIDFHEAIIYLTDAAPGQRPERLVATDPRGHFHQVHHHAGNPSGTYEDDSPAYWRELTDALSPAGRNSAAGTRQRERQTRRIAGWPTSKNITRTSQARWWRMCGSTSITWKRSRCSGWPSITSPAPPPEPSGRQRTGTPNLLFRGSLSGEAGCLRNLSCFRQLTAGLTQTHPGRLALVAKRVNPRQRLIEPF